MKWSNSKKTAMRLNISLALLSYVLLLAACQDPMAQADTEGAPTDSAAVTEAVNSHPVFTAIVDNLRVRNEPNTKAKTITMIPAFTEVFSLEEYSENIDTLFLREVLYEEPWLKIEYDGQQGWVFAGAIRAGSVEKVKPKWDIELQKKEFEFSYASFRTFFDEEELNKLQSKRLDAKGDIFYNRNPVDEYPDAGLDEPSFKLSFYEKQGKRIPHGRFTLNRPEIMSGETWVGLVEHGVLKRLYCNSWSEFQGSSYREFRFKEGEMIFAYGKVYSHRMDIDWIIYTDDLGKEYDCTQGEQQEHQEEGLVAVEIDEGNCNAKTYNPHHEIFLKIIGI